MGGEPIPAALLARASLAVVALVSVAAPLLLSGAPRVWSLPSLALLDAGVFVTTVEVCAVVAIALWSFEAIAERGSVSPRFSSLARWLATLAILAAMALVFYRVGPFSRIGDWAWVMAATETGRPYPRWYGATLFLAGFHRAAVALVASTPLESIRLGSSVCGALTAYLYWRLLDALGTPRVLRCWPFLYLSAFGVVGVGLAHVEVYAIVALAMATALWLGVLVAQAPRPALFFAFAVTVAAAMLTYISCSLFVPPAVALLLWSAARCRRQGRPRASLAALAALASIPALIFVIARFGPPPMTGSLWSMWSGQVGGPPLVPVVPAWLPADVFWPWFPSLLAPRYWLSGWHLSDVAQSWFLHDRAGIALALVLLGAMISRPASLPPAALYVLAVAGLYVAYMTVAVEARPQPWDWDVRSHAGLATSAAAAALLVAVAAGRRYDRLTEGLVVLVGILATFSGVFLLAVCAREPAVAGPPSDGFRLAVTPERIEVTPDGEGLAPLWLWLQNDGSGPVDVAWQRLTLSWQSDDEALPALRASQHRLLGGRRIEVGGYACLTELWERILSRAHRHRDPGPAGGLEGHVSSGRWSVTLIGDPQHPRLTLESNPVEIVFRSPPREARNDPSQR